MARNSRGTDDAGNEWTEFFKSAECFHGHASIPPLIAPTASIEEGSGGDPAPLQDFVGSERSGGDPAPLHCPVRSERSGGDPAPLQDSGHDLSSKSLLTVTVEDSASNVLEKALDINSIDQSCIDLSQPNELQQFFDDALWSKALGKIQGLLSTGSVFGGFFMHFGLTFNSQFRCAENPYGVKNKDHNMNVQKKKRDLPRP